MSNKIKVAVPTESMPKAWIKHKVSREAFWLHRRIKQGLQLPLTSNGGEKLTMTIELRKSDTIIDRANSLSLSTTHGPVRLFNHASFLQALTGISFEDELDNNHNLFQLLLPHIPKSLIQVLGWTALIPTADDNNQNTTCLPIRISEKDSSVVCFMEASDGVWKSLLSHSDWQPVKLSDENLPELSIDIPLTIGTTTIGLSVFKTLQPGDLLLIEHPLFDTNGSGRVKLGQREFSVKANTSAKTLAFEFLEWLVT